MLAYADMLTHRTVAHLKLTCDNISSSAWVSAGMLAMDPAKAQEAANRFHEHLVRTRRKSGYETTFHEDGRLAEQLAAFCVADPPALLWRNNGAYADLFRFLALRFLSQPDAVLHCESLHSQWKWIELIRRFWRGGCLFRFPWRPGGVWPCPGAP